MSSEIESQAPRPIVWMTKNPVTANLIMFFFLLGGAFIILTQIRQEIFPNFERDRVRITVAYPKASPDEIEQGIILAVEEGVRGLDGIKKTTSTSREGFGIVDCELHYDVDKNKIASDIKNVVNRISSFPEDAERPIVELLTTRNEVLHFVLYGDVEENVLRTLIEAVRYDLLKEENITQIDLEGTRSLEISIEIPKNTLRIYGLTLAQVAGTIENSAIEMSGGGVKTSGGEILIRMSERRNLAEEFKNLIVLSSPEGTEIRLEDIARITETFEDVDLISSFNGKRSVTAKVYRVRDQTPIDISQTVHRYKERIDKVLPPGVRSAVRFDRSVLLHERIDLLKRNALLGLLLVFGLLGLVLEVRLAFWVTMGIPISFLGSFVFLPVVDVSINMISLFAFIVTLGMVVDDAIVIGENIYYYRQRGESAVVASIKGAWEMATPVTFSILTTLVAFSPLFFVPGEMGKVIFILPAIIITVLLLSLFESIFILPAHLAHISDSKGSGLGRYLFKAQQRIGDLVEKTADSYYAPIVRFAVRHHWATLATGIAMLIVAGGMVAGERVKIDLFPKMESDWVLVRATLPIGAPMDQNEKVRRILERAAEKEVESLSAGRDVKILKGISTFVLGSHQIIIIASLYGSDERGISTADFVSGWRNRIGELPGIESLIFRDLAGGPGGGEAVDVRFSHDNGAILEQACQDLAESLKAYPGVTDIDDGFSGGKPQLNFTMKPEAGYMGISALDLASQVSSAFWGATVLQQQRGRDVIKAIVRHPKSERSSEYDVEEMLVRTPDGGEMPLFKAVDVKRDRSQTTINRTEGQRTVAVTASVDAAVTTSRKIMASLVKNDLPRLLRDYPGLSYSLEGEAKSGNEALESLFNSFYYALAIMYVLIAIPFRSYIQPIVVLSAIPFGFVGAVLGHLYMGHSIGLISLMGILALSGVVVNDSIVLIHTTNRNRETGIDVKESVCLAGIRRFRPIVLTSLTTFLGLTPMIFETSFQAKLLIPMAISLGFGVLFATVIILIIVPAIYVMVEDMKELVLELISDLVRLPKTLGRLFGFRSRIHKPGED